MRLRVRNVGKSSLVVESKPPNILLVLCEELKVNLPLQAIRERDEEEQPV